jgi:hypothetical protein
MNNMVRGFSTGEGEGVGEKGTAEDIPGVRLCDFWQPTIKNVKIKQQTTIPFMGLGICVNVVSNFNA